MSDRFSRLTTDRDADGVVTVVLHRPPVNAVNLLMYRELYELFVDIDQLGPGVRAAVLTGHGKHFCAGNDLDDFATMDQVNVRERMFQVREAFFAIQDCAVPVVGAVAGAALGTGLAIAASCDFVVAADDAAFGLPELSVGVHGGARHLGRVVSQPIVRWMYFTGQRLTGADMCALGAAIAVVPTSNTAHPRSRSSVIAPITVGTVHLDDQEHAQNALKVADQLAFMELGTIVWSGPRAEADMELLAGAYLGSH